MWDLGQTKACMAALSDVRQPLSPSPTQPPYSALTPHGPACHT